MSTTPLFLGVDGGGTKTDFICIDAFGKEVCRARAGTTYHLEVGFDEVVKRLEGGIASICGDLAIDSDDLAHVFFGLPAYGEDRTIDPRLHAACGHMLGHDRYDCGNDMVCGWAGSLACEDGINIVAGTGSIGYGERQGRTARNGGWGEMFSDEGSAYWIANQGLAAFARMSDGRAEKGPLHARIVEALELQEDIDLCQRVMGPPSMSRGHIAALAPLVTAAAADGDLVAHSILDEAADHLAQMAMALRRKLGFTADEPVTVSWSGSILTSVAPVRNRVTALLQEQGAFRFINPLHSPGHGAALYARVLAERTRG